MPLNKKTRTETIETLEEATLKEITRQVQAGENVPAATLKLAWDICKDAGVLANFDQMPRARDITDELPSFPEDETSGVVGKIG